MDEPRFLPHLAAACRELLGDDEVENISPATRSAVGAKAGVGQATVDRFLKGERVPRSYELDEMVSAVAATAKKDWTAPWKLATERAQEAKVNWEKFLTSGEPFDFAPKDSGEPAGEKRRPPRQR